MSFSPSPEVKYEVKAELNNEDEVLCRLCAEKSLEYCSIFDENLHESLVQDFGLSINRTDNWPKFVCTRCLDTTKICMEFLTSIRKAEASLEIMCGPLTEEVVKFQFEMIDVKDLESDPISDDCAEPHPVEDLDTKVEKKKVPRGKRKQVRPVKVKKNPPKDKGDEEVQEDEEIGENSERSERLLRRKRRPRTPSSPVLPKKGRRTNDDLKSEDMRIEQFFKLDCIMCSQPFTKWTELRTHFKGIHKKDPFLVCCEKKLINRIAIITHLNGHTNPDAYKCTECNKAFLNESRLNSHKLNKHIPVEQHKYKCPKCPKTFMIISSLNIHQAKHMTEDQKKFKCPNCPKVFAFNSMMRQHIRNIHEGGQRFFCEICAKEIKGKHTYEIHVNNHKIKGVGELSCTICEKKFKRQRLLKDHIERHNLGGDVFKCDVCGRYAPNRFALKRHIENIHLDMRKYECASCESAFKTKIALREHTATRHGTFYALYTCLFCDKQFNSSSNRYVHQKQKHPAEYQEMRQKKLLKERGVLDAEK